MHWTVWAATIKNLRLIEFVNSTKYNTAGPKKLTGALVLEGGEAGRGMVWGGGTPPQPLLRKK